MRDKQEKTPRQKNAKRKMPRKRKRDAGLLCWRKKSKNPAKRKRKGEKEAVSQNLRSRVPEEKENFVDAAVEDENLDEESLVDSD